MAIIWYIYHEEASITYMFFSFLYIVFIADKFWDLIPRLVTVTGRYVQITSPEVFPICTSILDLGVFSPKKIY